MEIDKTATWYDPACAQAMNDFYDKHIKDQNIQDHMGPFTELLRLTDLPSGDVLDLGCGTAMLSEFCGGFKYFGADLPHIVSGAAMRNYPQYYYRACDLTEDNLSWIEQYPIIIVNGVIDVMQYPLESLARILRYCTQYLIIHRQEIAENRQTQSNPGGGYLSPQRCTYHSIINRNDFMELLDLHHFEVVKELPLTFSNWENGGSSFLLRRRRSWALNQMDYKLNELFKGKTEGCFIEAGACDGITQSNTLYLEFYKNWNGALIEPVHEQWYKCFVNRSKNTMVLNGALVAPDYPSTAIEMIYTPGCAGLLSVVNDANASKLMERAREPGIHVLAPCFTLGYILNLYFQNKVIDLLVLDVEGYELNALKGVDLTVFHIEYILVEELEENTVISDYLAPWYERVDKLSDHDYLYKRKI